MLIVSQPTLRGIIKRHKRKHSGEFKAKVALEAIKGIKTACEIAQEYEIHPVMVSKWKKEMLEHFPEVFDSKKSSRREKVIEKEKEHLHRKVGQFTMEVDFLEKSAISWEYQKKIAIHRSQFSTEHKKAMPVTQSASIDGVLSVLSHKSLNIYG